MSNMRKMLRVKKKEAWLKKMAIRAFDSQARAYKLQGGTEKAFMSGPNCFTFNGKQLIDDDKLFYYKTMAWKKVAKESVTSVDGYNCKHKEKHLKAWEQLGFTAIRKLTNWNKSEEHLQGWIKEFKLKSQRDYLFKLSIKDSHLFWYTDEVWHALKKTCKAYDKVGKGILFFAQLEGLNAELNYKNDMQIWEKFYGNKE